jgi:hypothetical protein
MAVFRLKGRKPLKNMIRIAIHRKPGSRPERVAGASDAAVFQFGRNAQRDRHGAKIAGSSTWQVPTLQALLPPGLHMGHVPDVWRDEELLMKVMLPWLNRQSQAE